MNIQAICHSYSLKLPLRLSLVAVGAIGAFAMLAPAAFAAPYSDDAATPAQTAVAGALDTLSDPAASTYSGITASIDNLGTPAERADALGQLSVRDYRVLPRLAIQSMDATDRAIRGYLQQRREAALDASAGIPVSGYKTFNFMLNYGLKQAKYDGRIDRPRANSDSRSIQAAADVTLMPGLLVGATLGIDGIDMNLDRAQHPRSTMFSASLGGFASYTTHGYYIDVTGGYAYDQYKVRRQVSWTGFSDQLTSRPEGDNAYGSAQAGGIFKLGALRAQPFVGLDYRYADLSGAIESGGQAALIFAKYRTQSVRSGVGARLSGTFGSRAWTLRPSVEAQWQRELRNHPDSRIEAAFFAGGTPIFTLPAGRVLARDAALISAGLTATRSKRTSIRLAYTGEFASDRRVNAFSITVNRRLP